MKSIARRSIVIVKVGLRGIASSISESFFPFQLYLFAIVHHIIYRLGAETFDNQLIQLLMVPLKNSHDFFLATLPSDTCTSFSPSFFDITNDVMTTKLENFLLRLHNFVTIFLSANKENTNRVHIKYCDYAFTSEQLHEWRLPLESICP